MENTVASDIAEEIRKAVREQGKPERPHKIRIEQHSISGTLWFAGWLFTIGFLDLSFWRGVLAIIVWPYYLGTGF